MDGGKKLMDYLTSNNKTLLGASNASLKDGNSSHAWILTTSELDHINDSNMRIYGSGTADGFRHDLSSARGEILGQTALVIMKQNLLKAHDHPDMPVIFYGDNTGVQRKCQTALLNKLRDHQQPNHDLYLEYHKTAQSLNKIVKWIKGHQDQGTEWEEIQDSKHLKLEPAAYLNIWCDTAATKEHDWSVPIPDADVLPVEKWAL